MSAEVIRDIATLMVLGTLTAVLAMTGHDELAQTAIGGCLAFLVPWHRARVPHGVGVVGLAVGASLAMGCSGASSPGSVRRAACSAATQVCAAVDAVCSSGGESP